MFFDQNKPYSLYSLIQKVLPTMINIHKIYVYMCSITFRVSSLCIMGTRRNNIYYGYVTCSHPGVLPMVFGTPSSKSYTHVYTFYHTKIFDMVKLSYILSVELNVKIVATK